MLTLISFVLAGVGVVVAVLALILGDRDSPGVRYGAGFLLLLFTISLVLLGLFSYFGDQFGRRSAVDQPPAQTPAIASRGDWRICGEAAFNGDLQTSDPLFLRPEGYVSGWLSSDPSTALLDDGRMQVFESQYVLVIEGLSSVQVRGVQQEARKATAWGCWYSADQTTSIPEDVQNELCMKKAGGNVAVMYRVSPAGFEELATTETISCP